ncbi:right-handed parallel beta-helix repeat-containing protein [Ascidiimonas aurantiaca]|uniref:right-handed parallel beta-helix repeat-containing protein n=1 Tax=Ascidiimonas aurantiaca TaxID=1685432 RepID=UPI0030EB1F88
MKKTILGTLIIMFAFLASCEKDFELIEKNSNSFLSNKSSNSNCTGDYLVSNGADSKNIFLSYLDEIEQARVQGDMTSKIICIANDVEIVFDQNDIVSGEFFNIPQGVTIKSNGARFVSFFKENSFSFSIIENNDITIDGITFIAPLSSTAFQRGIQIIGNNQNPLQNILIQNCKIQGFNQVGIFVKNAFNIKVQNCYIHHNFGVGSVIGYGYGVSVADGGNVEIINNRFLFNRHAIASSNITSNSHYEARGNIVLAEYDNDPIIKQYIDQNISLDNLKTTHHFDAHGTGNGGQGGSTGTFIIEDNVFYNNRNFTSNNNKIISIRGIPRECSYVRNNIFPNGNGFDNLKQSSGDNSLIITNCSNNQFKNIIVEANTANNEPSARVIKNLIVIRENGDLINYPTLDDLKGDGILVGNGFYLAIYSDYLVGNWTGNGTSDLIVRNTQGELRALKFNGSTFYGQTINGESFPIVAHGFSETSYTDYLVGNWTGNGTSDLIVRNTQGELRALKFNGSTFYGQTINGESFPIVAHGFSETSYTDYLVGNWTGNGTSDLIVRNTQGELRALKFNGSTFYGQTINDESFPVVANGINELYSTFFVADWTNDNISDLLMINLSGDIFINKFNGTTFYGQTINGKSNPVKVFDGSLYKDYYIGDFTGDQYPDLLTIDNFNNVFLLKYNPSLAEFETPNLITTNFEYSKILIGDWNN